MIGSVLTPEALSAGFTYIFMSIVPVSTLCGFNHRSGTGATGPPTFRDTFQSSRPRDCISRSCAMPVWIAADIRGIDAIHSRLTGLPQPFEERLAPPAFRDSTKCLKGLSSGTV